MKSSRRGEIEVELGMEMEIGIGERSDNRKQQHCSFRAGV